MTDSFVTLFPTILILSTSTFSPSKILNFIEIESSTIVSSHCVQQTANYFFRLFHQFLLKDFYFKWRIQSPIYFL